MRKGQSSLEFVVLAAFMLLFFLVVTIGIQNQLFQAHVSRNEEFATELASVINNEAVLAASVGPGYSRTFYLPVLLDDAEYGIDLSEGVDLVIDFRGEEYLFFLDAPLNNATPLGPGENRVYNTVAAAGGGYVPPPPPPPPPPVCVAEDGACAVDDDCCVGTCYTDVDGDGYAPASGAKTCHTAAQTPGVDCYDDNADAHPGQTAYFTVHRGDGSFDYNCVAGEETNTASCVGTTYINIGTDIGAVYYSSDCSESGPSVSCFSYCTEGSTSTQDCGEAWNERYCRTDQRYYLDGANVCQPIVCDNFGGSSKVCACK